MVQSHFGSTSNGSECGIHFDFNISKYLNIRHTLLKIHLYFPESTVQWIAQQFVFVFVSYLYLYLYLYLYNSWTLKPGQLCGAGCRRQCRPLMEGVCIYKEVGRGLSLFVILTVADNLMRMVMLGQELLQRNDTKPDGASSGHFLRFSPHCHSTRSITTT